MWFMPVWRNRMVQETLLGMVQRHVRESEARIARQKVIIERLHAEHLDCAQANRLLATYQTALRELRLQRQRLMADRATTRGPTRKPK
jgi:hypothetical protein